MGHKPIPEKIKIVKGTFRKTRARNSPPQVDEKMQPPSWMPEEAKPHFEVLKARVDGIGYDSSTYTEALAMAATRLFEIDQCNKIIAEKGPTFSTTNINGDETLKNNPAVAQRSEAMRHLQSLLVEFGLSPSSISKLGTKKAKEKASAWESFSG